MMFLSYLLNLHPQGAIECGDGRAGDLIFLSELSLVDKTMISFSIIFSCILIAVSGILEEKHLIFDDPVHGPHDRLSPDNEISSY